MGFVRVAGLVHGLENHPHGRRAHRVFLESNSGRPSTRSISHPPGWLVDQAAKEDKMDGAQEYKLIRCHGWTLTETCR